MQRTWTAKECYTGQSINSYAAGRAVQLTGTLETASEIGVALAGFSGIVTALSDRAGQHWGPADWYRLKALLIWSLGASLLALLPSGLSAVPGLESPWRIAHAAFAIFHGSCLAWYFWEDRRQSFEEMPVLPVFVTRPTLPIAIAVFLAELAVAAGFLVPYGASLYLLAVTWFLFMAAITFSLLLLRGASKRPAA